MIELTFWKLCLISPPLLLIEGFFSGSEIAILSADKLALKKRSKAGDRRATLALRLANSPERVLSTTLLITSVCVVSNSALIVLFCLQSGYANADLVAVLLTTPLVVLLGELIPKMLYQKHSTELAPWVAYPINWTYWIFFPFTRILASYTTQLSRIIGPIETLFTGKNKTTREEIRSLLSYNKKEIEIKTSEKQMIKRIFDFKDTEAKNALIPLVRVDAIEDTATVLEALERFERHRHSRMPVFSDRIDNIIGTLEISDLLTATDLQQPIRHHITAAHYVSETQSLQDLIVEMQREDKEIVVVVDEHGGAVGILTFEDIVEEIVGEIRNEYDFETQPFKLINEETWSIQARMEIQQINEILKLDLPEGDYETLSGFLLQQFGRIPESRDELYFNTSTGPYRFTIQKATERHIESVLIQKLAKN